MLVMMHCKERIFNTLGSPWANFEAVHKTKNYG